MAEYCGRKGKGGWLLVRQVFVMEVRPVAVTIVGLASAVSLKRASTQTGIGTFVHTLPRSVYYLLGRTDPEPAPRYDIEIPSHVSTSNVIKRADLKSTTH